MVALHNGLVAAFTDHDSNRLSTRIGERLVEWPSRVDPSFAQHGFPKYYVVPTWVDRSAHPGIQCVAGHAPTRSFTLPPSPPLAPPHPSTAHRARCAGTSAWYAPGPARAARSRGSHSRKRAPPPLSA